MDEVRKWIELLSKEDVEKIVTIVTVIGGGAVAVLQYLHRIVNAQNMSEIEKVFMDRKQRTNLKLMDISEILFIMYFLNVALMLVQDAVFNGVLALATIGAFFLVALYFLYKLGCLVVRIRKKINKKWKYDGAVEQTLFACEILIGIEMGKLTYINTKNFWYGLIICLMAAMAITIILMISSKYWEEKPSRVSYKNPNGKKMFIYYKLDEDILLCGDNEDMKKAKINLVPFENFKKESHEIAVVWPEVRK